MSGGKELRILSGRVKQRHVGRFAGVCGISLFTIFSELRVRQHLVIGHRSHSLSAVREARPHPRALRAASRSLAKWRDQKSNEIQPHAHDRLAQNTHGHSDAHKSHT